MAQQSSELKITLNDSAVNRGIRQLSTKFKELQKVATKANEALFTGKQVAPKGAVRGSDGKYRDEKTGKFTSTEHQRGLAQYMYDKSAPIARAINSQAMHSMMRGMVGADVGAVIQSGFSGAGTLSKNFGKSMSGKGYGRVGGLFQGIGSAIPVMGGLAGSVLSQYMQRAQQASGLEQIRTRLRFAGASKQELNVLQRGLTDFGYSPQEALNLTASFLNQSGGKISALGGNVNTIARMQRAGIGSQVFGSLLAGSEAGGGSNLDTRAQFQQAIELTNFFRGQGLRGAGIERILSQVASNTASLARQGIMVDTKSMNEFTMNVAETAEKIGARQFMGAGALQIPQAMQRGAGGALQQMRSNFSSILPSMVLAQSAGATPLETMANIEAFMSAPETLQQRLGENYDPELIQLALTGQQLSTTGALIGQTAGKREHSIYVSGGSDIIKSEMGLSRALAERDASAMSQVMGNKGTAIAFIEATKNMERASLSLANSSAIKGLIGAVNALAKGELTDFIAEIGKKAVKEGVKEALENKTLQSVGEGMGGGYGFGF